VSLSALTAIPSNEATSFLALLEQQVKLDPTRLMVAWVNDKGEDEVKLSYGTVWRLSGAISYHLRHVLKLNKRDRIILCYPFGLDFMVAFIGRLSVPLDHGLAARSSRVAKALRSPFPPLDLLSIDWQDAKLRVSLGLVDDVA